MTLEHWLNIATHGLAPEPAARVRAEYLAHLEDALEAGESAEAVLREWGDPHTANRELSKAHLTTWEARYLPAGYAPTWAGLRKALSEDSFVLGLCAYMAVRHFSRAEVSQVMLLLLAPSLLAVVLRWLTLSRRAFSPQVRAALYWLLRPTSLGVLLLVAWVLWKASHDGWPKAVQELSGLGWIGLLILAVVVSHISGLFTGLSAARKAAAQASQT